MKLAAELGYLIGEKKLWGRGIGGKAVSEVISIAKKDFILNKFLV